MNAFLDISLANNQDVFVSCWSPIGLSDPTMIKVHTKIYTCTNQRHFTLVIPSNSLALDNKSKGVRTCFLDYSDTFNCNERKKLPSFLSQWTSNYFPDRLFSQPTVCPSKWHNFLSCHHYPRSSPRRYIVSVSCLCLSIFHPNRRP